MSKLHVIHGSNVVRSHITILQQLLDSSVTHTFQIHHCSCMFPQSLDAGVWKTGRACGCKKTSINPLTDLFYWNISKKQQVVLVLQLHGHHVTMQ